MITSTRGATTPKYYDIDQAYNGPFLLLQSRHTALQLRNTKVIDHYMSGQYRSTSEV